RSALSLHDALPICGAQPLVAGPVVPVGGVVEPVLRHGGEFDREGVQSAAGRRGVLGHADSVSPGPPPSRTPLRAYRPAATRAQPGRPAARPPRTFGGTGVSAHPEGAVL